MQLLAGVPVAVVQRYMGHSSIKTTLNYYFALPQPELREATMRAWRWFKGEEPSGNSRYVCATSEQIEDVAQKSYQTQAVSLSQDTRV